MTFVFAAAAALSALAQQTASPPTFKGGVERVALAVVVRDAKGKLVTDLTARDFELFDAGKRTPLIGVWSEPSPASVALLLDVSGSMATKMDRAREISRYFISGLQPGVDEVATFSFDTELKQLRPFSTSPAPGDPWSTSQPFGATSMWDAIADTSSRISDRQRRRALIVITDGVDSASKRTPAEVSTIASSLDVPVYVVVISTAEDPLHDVTPVQGPLADLATWTGGQLLVVRDTPTAMTAAKVMLNELQHQYIVAFEPGTVPGWHPLVVRTTKNGLFVRARSGYTVAQ